MGRHRSFDVSDVVSRSASAFLRTGYEGTSVDDLVRATGLHRGSIYQAFGSKRGLFLAALRHTVTEDARSTAALDLLLVATLELAPRDIEVRGLVARSLEKFGSPDPGALLGHRLMERAQLQPISTQDHA